MILFWLFTLTIFFSCLYVYWARFINVQMRKHYMQLLCGWYVTWTQRKVAIYSTMLSSTLYVYFIVISRTELVNTSFSFPILCWNFKLRYAHTKSFTQTKCYILQVNHMTAVRGKGMSVTEQNYHTTGTWSIQVMMHLQHVGVICSTCA